MRSLLSPRERAVLIAKSIARLITEDGGTSSHVGACSVTLPASTFDMIQAEARLINPKEAPNQFPLYGVLFVRGKDDETIRKEAQ